MTLRAAVVGTGLIGASVGAGLRVAGWTVAAWDPDPDSLATATTVGGVDTAVPTLAQLLELDVDVLVIAAPPAAVIDLVGELRTEALVTDVAGVKVPVVEAARGVTRFVGGHPMAGREAAGADHASPALFRGAAWIVTTDGATEQDVELVESMVHVLGARPVRMSAAEHDEAVALVSHLPQLLAMSLLESAASTGHALDLAAGSFRDLTRVASSDPVIWDQVLSSNHEAVAARLRSFAADLDGLAVAIDGKDSPQIRARLEQARELRETLAPPVVSIEVALADEPGELAKVGQALAGTGVDVRDLQLRHGRHGGGGVLTLAVRPGEATMLRDALEAQGLELVG